MNLNYNYLDMIDYLNKHTLSSLLLDVSYEDLKAEFGNDIPSHSVSRLAYNFLNSDVSDNVDVIFYSATPKIIRTIHNNGLEKSHPTVYLIASLSLIECLATYYYMDNDRSQFENTSSDIIKNIRRNINLLCDWFGDYNKYWDIILDLRSIEISLGYIENQLTFLINNVNFRTDNLY